MSASDASVVRSSSRRKLFAPTPVASFTSVASTAATGPGNGNGANGAVDDDAALAAAMPATEARRSYSLRRRTPSASTSTTNTPTRNATQKRTSKTSTKRSRAASPSTASEASDSAAGSDFSADEASASSDHDSDVFSAESTSKRRSSSSKPTKPSRKTASPSKPSTPKRSKSSTSPKKPPPSPFDVSPRKPTKKPWKVNLEPHEAHPAPAHWETVYTLLSRQRTKIVAPVDTMGCEENGRADRRADSDRALSTPETPEEEAKRERLATLVSLMLSSQTKDPVTAEAVYNLQRTLPNGLCLQSLLEADDETISQCIAKVGFWRRKTGYLKSAAQILASDFDGDVPRTVDELISLPGVGPKMAFLALSSMGIQIGIGVDTHVHRLTNRLGWHSTKTPEETRLNLQSWLPEELHGKINRLLVGFGQVICVPVGPRCDLCDVGKAGLCPSRRKVDGKSVEKRVKVEMLDSDDDGLVVQDNWVKVKREEASVKVELEVDGPDGKGMMEVGDLMKAHKEEEDGKGGVLLKVKQEEDPDAALVEKALEW
ncbi:Endonuclease III-like protein [Pseudozyma hubeiensis]|nr:Endonuclease III-like protein [Pseudozyma hubeiensis]